jgi:hypothetical protein
MKAKKKKNLKELRIKRDEFDALMRHALGAIPECGKPEKKLKPARKTTKQEKADT